MTPEEIPRRRQGTMIDTILQRLTDSRPDMRERLLAAMADGKAGRYQQGGDLYDAETVATGRLPSQARVAALTVDAVDRGYRQYLERENRAGRAAMSKEAWAGREYEMLMYYARENAAQRQDRITPESVEYRYRQYRERQAAAGQPYMSWDEWLQIAITAESRRRGNGSQAG